MASLLVLIPFSVSSVVGYGVGLLSRSIYSYGGYSLLSPKYFTFGIIPITSITIFTLFYQLAKKDRDPFERGLLPIIGGAIGIGLFGGVCFGRLTMHANISNYYAVKEANLIPNYFDSIVGYYRSFMHHFIKNL